MVDGSLNSILSAFEGIVTVEPGRIHSLAVILFQRLVLIEVIWTLIQLVLDSEHRKNILGALLSQVIGLNFFFWLLLNGPSLTKAVFDSFMKFGGRASGTGSLDPSSVADQGIAIAGQITDTLTLFGAVLSPIMTSFVGIIAILIALVYVAIALQMMITLFESYVLVAGSSFFLAFSGARWTRPLSEKFIGGVLAVGVKIFTLYTLIAIGTEVSLALQAQIKAYSAQWTPSSAFYFKVLFAVGVYGGLVWIVPKDAFSWSLGGVSMGVPQLLRTLAAGASAARAGAGLAKGAALAAGGAALAGGFALAKAARHGLNMASANFTPSTSQTSTNGASSAAQGTGNHGGTGSDVASSGPLTAQFQAGNQAAAKPADLSFMKDAKARETLQRFSSLGKKA